jgi:hypothetical protein
MTGAVWAGAVAGAVTKLLFPGRFETRVVESGGPVNYQYVDGRLTGTGLATAFRFRDIVPVRCIAAALHRTPP